MTLSSAIKKVNAKGMLLVFPHDNRQDPPSLWSEFFPRSKMRWEWDQEGDTRVSDLWHLREQLSSSGQVIYNKWFRNRATLISQELFAALLKLLNPGFPEVHDLSRGARDILDLLMEDSPLSTKELKRQSELQGRENESYYNRTLQELWRRQLLVVQGEVDEGAFPSIAIGATEVLFENIWQKASSLTESEAEKALRLHLEKDSAFLKFYLQLRKRLRPEIGIG